VLVQDFARMVPEFAELLDGAEDMPPFDFLSACARLPPLYAAGINLPDADPEDDSATRSMYPFDESRGVSPAMGLVSARSAQQSRVVDLMVSSFCARCAVATGIASEASGCCAQCAVAKGDPGDHVWLLRVLAQGRDVIRWCRVSARGAQ
jgi:hypothetical protein